MHATPPSHLDAVSLGDGRQHRCACRGDGVEVHIGGSEHIVLRQDLCLRPLRRQAWGVAQPAVAAVQNNAIQYSRLTKLRKNLLSKSYLLVFPAVSQFRHVYTGSDFWMPHGFSADFGCHRKPSTVQVKYSVRKATHK